MGKKMVDINKDLDEVKEKIDRYSQNYFRDILGFLKWTTTFAFGTMLWFGVNLLNFSGEPKKLLIIGLGSLIVSIIFAIYLIFKVFIYWNIEWKFHYHHHKWLIFEKGKLDGLNYSNELHEKAKKEFVDEMIRERAPYTNPTYFQNGLIVHISAILFGLLMYFFALLST
jgi:hypothetical protein